jgi:ABC-2 type transport system ATP-binding protein
MQAIETVALTKRFRRVEAVTDLNLQVAEGAVYALMGPNGAGKTTLIKLLMNLLQPNSGRAMMLGRNATALRGGRLEAIGYVSENQKLPDWMRVDEFLSYWRPFYPTWDRALEQQLMKRFELPVKQKLKRLSRGMRMKASLASVLSYRPKLIVLDEPLSGLDPLVRDELMAGLLESASETTVLISSHDLAEIDSFATHVGYMAGGRLRLSEPMAGVKERFRRVEVTAPAPLTIPETLPPEWLQFSAQGNTVRWVETGYESAASQSRVHGIFGPAVAEVQINATSLTLREVFLTMARISQAAKAERSAQ